MNRAGARAGVASWATEQSASNAALTLMLSDTPPLRLRVSSAADPTVSTMVAERQGLGGSRQVGELAACQHAAPATRQRWQPCPRERPSAPMHPPCSVPYLLATASETGMSALMRPGEARIDSSCRPLRAVVSKQRLGRRREGEMKGDDDNHGQIAGPQKWKRNPARAVLCPERGQPIRRLRAASCTHLAPSGPRCCNSARRKPMPISLDMAGSFTSGDEGFCREAEAPGGVAGNVEAVA